MAAAVTIVVLAGKEDSTSDLRRLVPLLRDKGVSVGFWGWDLGWFCELGFGLSRASRVGRLKVGTAYAWWALRVFLRALVGKGQTLYFCIMFEAALPIAMASVFRKTAFVFANMDNAPLRMPPGRISRRLVTGLERFVARRAAIHKLPTAARWNGREPNVRFVENAPTRSAFEAAVARSKERGHARDAALTVYVNGWLSNLRGAGTLAKAITRCRHQIRVILAGKLMCADAEALARLDCCEYVGELRHVDAMALYARAHIVFTFYDPVLEIDRLASSGKWSECVLFGVPFLVNDEVETVATYREAGACFSVPYHDADALCELIDRLAADRQQWEAVRTNLGRFSAEFWDERMIHLLRDAGCDLV